LVEARAGHPGIRIFAKPDGSRWSAGLSPPIWRAQVA
jgi:hypothetical protein